MKSKSRGETSSVLFAHHRHRGHREEKKRKDKNEKRKVEVCIAMII